MLQDNVQLQPELHNTKSYGAIVWSKSQALEEGHYECIRCYHQGMGAACRPDPGSTQQIVNDESGPLKGQASHLHVSTGTKQPSHITANISVNLCQQL